MIPENIIWEFSEKGLGEMIRDPHDNEFFLSGESVSDALVREVIQNSLDARKGKDTVTVNFSFATQFEGYIDPYIKELIPHLKACKLFDKKFEELKKPFLLIDDFGTTGLDGDTGEDGTFPKSNFFMFWIWEGGSQKTGRKGGRWGLGKSTFHMASQIKTFWGLTVRNDDERELLYGKASLKSHQLKGRMYSYEVYFRNAKKPIDNTKYIQKFKEAFKIKRGRGKQNSGLSLIIPFPQEGIIPQNVLKSVLVNYFYPILEGELNININDEENGINHKINSENIIDIAKSIDWKGTIWADIEDIDELLHSIKESIQINQFIELRPSQDNGGINEKIFGEDLERIREEFNQEKMMAFKIFLKLKPDKQKESDTYFTVFLKNCSHLNKSEEFYIRSGIRISEIHSLGNRSIRGLFVAKDGPISKFLGDAETPAHTDWKERTEGFKDKYNKASSRLRFIKNSMRNIASIIDVTPRGVQKNYFKNIFNIPQVFEEKENEKKDKAKEDILPDFESKPSIFEVIKLKDGFKIILNEKVNLNFPVKASIKIAYDIRRGNPFNHHNIWDFDLSKKPIVIDTNVSEKIKILPNKIKFAITKKDFFMEITGFDQNRDVIYNLRRIV